MALLKQMDNLNKQIETKMLLSPQSQCIPRLKSFDRTESNYTRMHRSICWLSPEYSEQNKTYVSLGTTYKDYCIIFISWRGKGEIILEAVERERVQFYITSGRNPIDESGRETLSNLCWWKAPRSRTGTSRCSRSINTTQGRDHLTWKLSFHLSGGNHSEERKKQLINKDSEATALDFRKHFHSALREPQPCNFLSVALALNGLHWI